MITLFKVLLSIPIGVGLVYPFWQSDVTGGILAELRFFGTVGTFFFIAIFLLLVYCYIQDLIKTLERVSPASRKAKPNSVWFMFLLPYNFIEDFVIVSNVTKSLEAEATVNPALASFKSYGMVSGLGWCIAQIVSLIPNELGSLAGLAAIGFWIWHWVFIRRVNKVLATHREQNASKGIEVCEHK